MPRLLGHLLHVEIPKSKDILKASNGHPYIRKGAQKLRVDTPEGLHRLQLDKGIISFEDDVVNTALQSVTNSVAVINFMLGVIPTGDPEAWLRKEQLIGDDRPTVAGVMLFHDEPQSALPKRTGVKIYRYKTREDEGTREQLASDPITIEGCAYNLIYEAVRKTKEIVQGICKLTDKGLEEVLYPDETLHEIITNAVLHRDYSIPSDIHIRIYDNRVEVQSPGKTSWPRHEAKHPRRASGTESTSRLPHQQISQRSEQRCRGRPEYSLRCDEGTEA